jgi:hypothetical protein
LAEGKIDGQLPKPLCLSILKINLYKNEYKIINTFVKFKTFLGTLEAA